MDSLTPQTIAVLAQFIADPGRHQAGIEIIRASGLRAGTAYPIMLRLERKGMLDSYWESTSPSFLGRPRRRYYMLTEAGRKFAESVVA